MSIFIGGAWPYANGSLHLGRVASLLPGDILARYFRLKGEAVLYVSGSDCHGTPISIQANQEGVTPHEIAERYHNEFVDCFKQLGFSYDLYTRTDDEFHHKVVQQLFLKLLKNENIYKKSVEQTFCVDCDQFLPDRYVEGICPHCGQKARGDQCDFCSSLLDPTELHDKKCKLCGSSPTVRFTEHYFLALSKFQVALEDYVKQATGWRSNAIQLTERYLSEGLHDRAATRDLPWGVDVPIVGFEGKKIYVWIEAVSGYLSASMKWAQLIQTQWEPFWSEGATAYYVHGKDNIPFHSLILPALLLGTGNLHLPDRIISSEYLTLEGKKFSTSNNWAVWVPYILANYHPDSVRYFLTINGPENRDTDFSWREFIYSHNGELLGAFGNFVNRNLLFLVKAFDGSVPDSQVDEAIKQKIIELYEQVGVLIEAGKFKIALEAIFSFIRASNKYFDERKPWAQVREENPANGWATLFTCVQIIANLANILEPFLPFSCEKIRGFLSLPLPSWGYIEVPPHRRIETLEVLFERIDISNIQEEESKLRARKE
ncbi:methionine--tRNA ligase [Paenibacillus psychroresistens]|uniref:Methionine--tRNA ligase n=1 Tax=Paenibacillus psychroresistens TaxID=1778678 RepID=A0A6B8RDK3_9BACL|nr:methionine--tRNA ligase [Paenibacillus psychroresistens]QGQ93997.1 methionine--tRNA ligase [Paenibacillus psychroresistens]